MRLPEHTIIEVKMQPEPVQDGIEVQVAIINIGMISQNEQPAAIIYEICYRLDLLSAVFLLRSFEDKYADSFQGLGGNRPVQYCRTISDGIQIPEGGMGQAVVIKVSGVQLMVKSVVCYMAIFLLPEGIHRRDADDEEDERGIENARYHGPNPCLNCRGQIIACCNQEEDKGKEHDNRQVKRQTQALDQSQRR